MEAVIFDMDGTLIDTEEIYTTIFNEIFKRYGVGEFDWDIKGAIIGLPIMIALERVIKHYSLPLTPPEFFALMQPLEEKYFPQVNPLPGALELVSYLANKGVPIALATSSPSSSFLHKTSHLPQIFNHFPPDKIIKGDDPRLQRGKPHPDIFILAAQQLGINTAEARKKVLVFEDGPNGVQAAKAAGMNVVWVPDQNHRQVIPQSEIEALGEITEIKSLKDVKPNEWGL